MSSYLEEFLEAYAATVRLGYRIPPSPVIQSRRVLSEERFEELEIALDQRLDFQRPKRLRYQCIGVSCAIQQTVERICACNAYLTLGFVTVEGKDAFRFTEADVRSWRDQSRSIKQGRDMHAWLTLDSSEIVDVTLALSRLADRKEPIVYTGMVAKHPDNLNTCLIYHPVVVGTKELLSDIGAIMEFDGG